jgi:riboflavin synthase
MFTGIVEELGEVASVTDLGDSVRLSVRADRVTADAEHGDSIAVNGCCLTVRDNHGVLFTVDVMKESLDKTSIGQLAVGSPVNLERAVQVHTRLGGHIVQGHVDAVGTVSGVRDDGFSRVVTIDAPTGVLRYMVEKGSIAVNGVSLTVSAISGDAFEVSLIPETLQRTTLGQARPGTVVNLEVDVLAKYVEKLLPASPSAGEPSPEAPVPRVGWGKNA